MLLDDEYTDVNSKRTDVRIASKASIHARASNLFDPRQLGMTDIYILGASIKDGCLYRFDDIQVESVILDEKKVYRVYRKDGEKSWEMFIEEPGFRLLKVIDTWPPLKVTVVNEYDNDKYGPFPKKSSMLREQNGKKVFLRQFEVTRFEEKKSFPKDTFTLASLNLPINTMATDYRIQRVAGYWDGEKLVDKPVRISAQEQRELEEELNTPRSLGIARVVLISTGALLIAFAIFFMIRKKR